MIKKVRLNIISLLMCLGLFFTACDSSNSNYNSENEIEEEITVTDRSEISSFDAARTMGRRIIEREFPDKVTENTIYVAIEEEEDHPGSLLIFAVEAVFEPDSTVENDVDYILRNADVRVEFRPSIYGLTFEYRRPIVD